MNHLRLLRDKRARPNKGQNNTSLSGIMEWSDEYARRIKLHIRNGRILKLARSAETTRHNHSLLTGLQEIDDFTNLEEVPIMPNFTTYVRNTINLLELVDIKVLQRIQDTFAKAMGVAAVTVDRSGTPVTQESNFQPICRMIRSTCTGAQRCILSDSDGGMQARQTGGPYLYVCRGGMLDIAAPIIIQGEYLGSILCGQVIPTAEREEFIEKILSCNSNLGLSLGDLRQAAQLVPNLPRERIDAAGEMLFQMANYICEMGAANLNQAHLLEKEKERAALHSALQDAQIRMLQSQISPHFLFNALGLITYTALEESAQKTGEIAYSLSDLLRYSLRNITAEVTLGQEIDLVNHYLNIQTMRFRSRLNVSIDIEEHLLQIRIPCMILQPLVENAVVHAVEPLSRPVNIIISAHKIENRLVLEVIDDGVGMDSMTLAVIREIGASSKANGNTALGLKNVLRRLELQYGDMFDFHIDAQSGQGTQISLTIPIA